MINRIYNYYRNLQENDSIKVKISESSKKRLKNKNKPNTDPKKFSLGLKKDDFNITDQGEDSLVVCEIEPYYNFPSAFSKQ